jgi:hypothetical protein
MKQLLCVAALLSLFPTAAQAILDPQQPSKVVTVAAHFGSVPGPDDTLPCPNCPGAREISKQTLPDGTIVPFSIPAGKVFVVTSFSWNTITVPPLNCCGQPGVCSSCTLPTFCACPYGTSSQTMSIEIDTGSSCSNFIQRDGSPADGTSGGYGRHVIPHGLIIKPGADANWKLCAAMGGTQGTVILHGFLRPDR